MNAVSTPGIDLAKNPFSVHGVDAQGAAPAQSPLPTTARKPLEEYEASHRPNAKEDDDLTNVQSEAS
jgi:hypothetical protein